MLELKLIRISKEATGIKIVAEAMAETLQLCKGPRRRCNHLRDAGAHIDWFRGLTMYAKQWGPEPSLELTRPTFA